MSSAVQAAPKKKLRAPELAALCSLLSYSIRAGMPLVEAVSAVHDDLHEGRLCAAAAVIAEETAAGNSLAGAMKKCGVFPPYFIGMVQVGETTGELDIIFDVLSSYYERDHALRERARSAVLYPSVLFIMMGAVLAVLIIAVLPLFARVYRQMGGSVAGSGAAMLHFGTAAGVTALAFIVFLLLGSLITWICLHSKRFGSSTAAFLRRLPIVRGVSKKLAAWRITGSLSFLIRGGADPRTSLAMARAIVGDPSAELALDQCASLIEKGCSLPKALAEAGIFDHLSSRLVLSAERTGNLDEILTHIADLSETEADCAISDAVALVEPVLVGLLTIIIGAVLLAVMLPLAGALTSIGLAAF